jgi:trk system potassium uptake protein TrkH
MFKDVEAKLFIKIIALFTGITLVGIYVSRGISFGQIEEVFRKTLFQIVSVVTTTGFGTQDIGSDFFPAIAKQLFLLLMIIGGCVGSTSGGIKVLRLAILQKLLKREVEKLSLPSHTVLPTTINHMVIGQDEIQRITAIVFGWILLICIGAGITALFSDLGPLESFSGMASAVGNIGPFYFSVEKMVSLSWVIKVTYIIGMLGGRLELLPIYIIISKKAWK